VLANKAKNAVASCSASSRITQIEIHAQVWRDLKEPLGRISSFKCHYCETAQVRDDFEVDHFRPKSGKPADGHTGYWWLAFDITNLRFSCRFCNQRRRDIESGETGGKGSSFPLLNEAMRARSPNDLLDDESPALLDPKKRYDPSAISFDDVGVAVPFADKSHEPDDFERARISIKLYNLNHGYLRRRRGQRALQIKAKIAAVSAQQNLYLRRKQQGQHQAALDAKLRIEELILEIKELLEPDQEYSSLIRSILRLSDNGSRPWIRRILQNAP
jgi:hypothetical protein